MQLFELDARLVILLDIHQQARISQAQSLIVGIAVDRFSQADNRFDGAAQAQQHSGAGRVHAFDLFKRERAIEVFERCFGLTILRGQHAMQILGISPFGYFSAMRCGHASTVSTFFSRASIPSSGGKSCASSRSLVRSDRRYS